MSVLVVMASVLVVAIIGVIQALSELHPQPRTTARERLLALNPGLRIDASRLRWSVRARRVRFGWFTSLLVAVALLVASDRPTSVADGSPTTRNW